MNNLVLVSIVSGAEKVYPLNEIKCMEVKRCKDLFDKETYQEEDWKGKDAVIVLTLNEPSSKDFTGSEVTFMAKEWGMHFE